MSPSSTFGFQAVRRNGTLETGVVEAPDREAAVALIKSRGAFPVHVAQRAESLAAQLQIGAEDLAAGLRALATLVGSGIPLPRALSLLDELVPAAWLPALPLVRQRIDQGGDLAAALDASSLPLPSHVIGVIRAGEAGSGLAVALAAAAELLETRSATGTAIRNALAYPIMLAIAGAATAGLLVGVVLPRFANLLAETGQALPLSTRLVLGVGNVLHAAFLPGVIALGGLTILWRKWVASSNGLMRWHELLRALPVAGPLRRSYAAAHACSALAALLREGVPLLAALPYAARAAGDGATESRLLAARGRIEKGERISSACQAEDALTPTVVRLIGIGEESGKLAQMFSHGARIEADYAAQRLRRMIRVLEPVLILLFGGIVMMVAAALFQAVYGLRPSL